MSSCNCFVCEESGFDNGCADVGASICGGAGGGKFPGRKYTIVLYTKKASASSSRSTSTIKPSFNSGVIGIIFRTANLSKLAPFLAQFIRDLAVSKIKARQKS